LIYKITFDIIKLINVKEFKDVEKESDFINSFSLCFSSN